MTKKSTWVLRRPWFFILAFHFSLLCGLAEEDTKNTLVENSESHDEPSAVPS